MPACSAAQAWRRRGPPRATHAPRQQVWPAAGSPGLRLGVALLQGLQTQVERAQESGSACANVGGRLFSLSPRSCVRLPLLLFFFFLEPEVLTLCSQLRLLPAWDLKRTCPGWSCPCSGIQSSSVRRRHQTLPRRPRLQWRGQLVLR